MNQRTAKLIRRYAALWDLPYAVMKKTWFQAPRNRRHELRLTMEANLRNAKKREHETAKKQRFA